MGDLPANDNYNGFSGQVKLNAGDILSFRSGASGTLSNSNTNHWVGITKQSGPAVVLATEIIAASYFLSSNTSFTNQINFDGKLFDTHNAVTTGASWKFTAPITGIYQVSTSISWNSGSPNSGAVLFKNGSSVLFITNAWGSGGGDNFQVTGSALIQLNAGDTIDLRPGGTTTLTGTASPTYVTTISINRLNN